MSDYNQLLAKSIKVLEKYSLAAMVNGIDVATVHGLMRQHKDSLVQIDTYEKGKLLADSILSTMIGFPMQVASFIKDERDIEALYDVMVEWRDAILA